MTYLQKFENWYPIEEITTLRNRMDRLMSRFGTEPNEELVTSQWVPTADIVDTKNAIVVKAELPGLTEKDIFVEIENGLLTIRGERKFEKETNKDYLRTERAYGTFLRTFTLPSNVIPEKIAASYVNGVLEVEIPKKEEAKPRMIAVDVKKKLPVAA